MRLKFPPIFIFSIILLVGLLASTISHAQKKFSLPKIPQIHFVLPHFKNPFAKDSTNKSFNNWRWFNYQKEASYTKNENAMPIAVGYTDFDENIRDLQLLGKLPTDNSLTIRPYILPKSVTYDSLLKAIDPSLKNNGHLVHKKHFDVQLLPFNYLQKYNSHHPYGWNDGPLSFSKGYQYLASGGVYMHWRNIHLTLRPEYFHTASDKYETSAEWGQVNPSLNKLILGQSSLRVDLGPLSISTGTNNLWLGPGIFSSLIMSNNAQGFLHTNIFTNRPLKTFIGDFEFALINGYLTQNYVQGYEINNLKKTWQSSYKRYLNLATVTYKPFSLTNLKFGFNRVFYTPVDANANFSKLIETKNLLIFNSLFRNQYRDDNLPIDQILSVFTRVLFPKSNAEVYFEYGLNDGSSNLRELNLDLSHSSASIFGIKKIQKLNDKKFINIHFEATRMSQTPSYLLRNAGDWYEHGAISEGYTNENQILGAGSGMGNNLQTLFVSLNQNINSIGFKFQHISHNPIRFGSGEVGNLWLRTTKWNDFCYGINFKFKKDKFIFSSNIEYVNSLNYLWKNELNRNNTFITLNTIYLW